MTNFTIRQLEIFCAVAEMESFTCAAEALHLTQSTISTHIKSFEKIAGYPILARDTHSFVSLTPEGKQLYPLARKILDNCNSLTQTIADVDYESQQPPLLIGASTVPCQYLLPQLLSAYHVSYPQVRYRVLKGDSSDIHRMLRDQDIRIGFTGTMLAPDEFNYTPIWSDELVVAAPNSSYYQTLKVSGTYGKDLLNHPTIAREEGSGTDRTVRQYMERNGLVRSEQNIIARVDDPEAIKHMVEQNGGISVLSNLAIQKEIEQKLLLAFPMDANGLHRNIYLVTKRSVTLSSQERIFIHTAQSH